MVDLVVLVGSNSRYLIVIKSVYISPFQFPNISVLFRCSIDFGFQEKLFFFHCVCVLVNYSVCLHTLTAQSIRIW